MLRTKIVATVGPATATRDGIERICRAGANVIRINFAHGDADGHRAVVRWVREVAGELGVPIAILADLAGPKIRIGDLPAPRPLTEGQEVSLVPADVAAGGDLPTTYPELASDVSPGNRIILDDGRLELRVLETDPPRVTAVVERGGVLLANKGINLPGIRVSAPALTAKDRQDLEVAVEAEVDFVGLSFVQRPEDVAELRSLIPDHMLVVAKIEKDLAVERIQEILDCADAVMVARGDLGVELPFEQVPVVQKRIIQLANLYARPGDHGNPDARVHDRAAPSDPGGGQRCGQCSLRRHRCRHAFRGDGGRQAPDTGRGGHGSDRAGDRADGRVRGGAELRHPGHGPSPGRRHAHRARHRRGHRRGRAPCSARPPSSPSPRAVSHRGSCPATGRPSP
jgi:hypothetical protein